MNLCIYGCGTCVVIMAAIMIIYTSILFQHHVDHVLIVSKHNILNENYKLNCKLSQCVCNTQLNHSYTSCDNLNEFSTPYCIGGSLCCDYKYDTCKTCAKALCYEVKCNPQCIASVEKSQCEYSCVKEYEQQTINTVLCKDGERNITTHGTLFVYSSGTDPNIKTVTHLSVTNCIDITYKYINSPDFIAMAFFMGLFDVCFFYSIYLECRYNHKRLFVSVINPLRPHAQTV